MPGGRPKKRRDFLDPVDWEQAYHKTGDVRFASLAIGRFPGDPPAWAIQACRAAFEKQENATELLFKPGPLEKLMVEDIKRLDRMAELMAPLQMISIHAAAREAAGGKGSKDPEVQRLERLWRAEEYVTIDDYGAAERQHPRLERATRRWLEQRQKTFSKKPA